MTDPAILDFLARLDTLEEDMLHDWKPDEDPTVLIVSQRALIANLEQLVKDVREAAVEAEREACAKVAGAHVLCDWSRLPGKAVDDSYGRQIAAAIRARSRGEG